MASPASFGSNAAPYLAGRSMPPKRSLPTVLEQHFCAEHQRKHPDAILVDEFGGDQRPQRGKLGKAASLKAKPH